jgi:hypothetical protein
MSWPSCSEGKVAIDDDDDDDDYDDGSDSGNND